MYLSTLDIRVAYLETLWAAPDVVSVDEPDVAPAGVHRRPEMDRQRRLSNHHLSAVAIPAPSFS